MKIALRSVRAWIFVVTLLSLSFSSNALQATAHRKVQITVIDVVEEAVGSDIYVGNKLNWVHLTYAPGGKAEADSTCSEDTQLQARPSDTSYSYAVTDCGEKVKFLVSDRPRSLMPGAQPGYFSNNISSTLKTDRDFSRIFSAFQVVGLDKLLATPGPYTVFIPNNRGFGSFPSDLYRELAKSDDKAAISTLLKYGVVCGDITPSRLSDAMKKKGG